MDNVPFARAYQIMSMTLTLFIGFGFTSWFIYYWKVGPSASVNVWFNGEDLSGLSIVVGCFANIIFGFIDNAGLFFGANFLDEWFQMLPGADDANVFSGYGNTYSDLIGALMGTFCGLMIEDLTKVHSTPIWGDAIGIIIGCLLGVAIPKMIMGHASELHGINKVGSKTAFLGEMDEKQLNLLLDEGCSLLQFRAQSTFSKLDANDSGTLDVGEIRS